MKITELYRFVSESNVATSRNQNDKTRIATLGLVSEIGSVLSVLKKDILSTESTDTGRHLMKGELKEQLGDAIWYSIMLADCQEDPLAKNIFSANIAVLSKQLQGKTRNDLRVQDGLAKSKAKKFLRLASTFLELGDQSIDEYQVAAYWTRRTEGDELRNICAVVLQQLAAQVSRDFLPNKEMILNHEVRPKDPVEALGEVVWHLAALASLFDLKLSEVMKLTQEKATFRRANAMARLSHKSSVDSENFPDNFCIHFVPLSQNTAVANMYLVANGEAISQLGDSLTDNDHEGDGYRFHDVMHIAFAVHLGWSPNLRKFMDLKRHSLSTREPVEDGGRAKILEEAVILQVHLLAQSFQEFLPPNGPGNIRSPFEAADSLSFGFLRQLHELCKGHEVYANPKEDWENAIREGYECYLKLRASNGGIVTADVTTGKLSFMKLNEAPQVDYSKCPQKHTCPPRSK